MGTRTTLYGLGGIGMTPVIKALLIVNIGVFLLTSFVRLPVDLNLLLGLTPYLVLKGMIWQLATYMFLHGNLSHILFNMLALWMFGTVLERTWGSRLFLRFYMVCGIGAGICVVLAALAFGDRNTTIGASGAIYGLLVAFGIMFPNATILAFLFFPMPAKYFVILMGGISFFLAIQSGGGGTVSHIAHLGGFVVGYLYLKRLEYRPAPAYSSGRFYGHSRRGPSWVKWFTIDEWRMRYANWKRRRLKKQFEVYMRKQNGGGHNDRDRWVN